jgi:SEL1 protein
LSEWITNFLRDDRMYDIEEQYDDAYVPNNDPMPGGDTDGMYDDVLDDGILESLIIIGLAATLVCLIYYRQVHQAARRENQADAVQQHGQQPPGEQRQAIEDRGLFPQPGNPDFGPWVAGGVGH